MFFNSVEFFVFFLVVLSLYYVLPHRWQNRLLLLASYVFYGWWDWRFLSLIFISTVVDYSCGLGISQSSEARSKTRYLCLSVAANLTILGFFKYWNFFIESVAGAFTTAGITLAIPSLHIILPVGISFYTFQTMTYSIDIYRGDIRPTRNFWDFALFVSFFPQLVAGPIERAKSLLPQILGKRRFCVSQFTDGLHLIFWGMFKKVFVADNLGMIADRFYGAPDATGFQYILATFAFALQIYGDFSGYSDIARGTAKCLGIELMVNFRQPYIAVNPSDLWQRWHISLSTWLRDYLYIPLGGNRQGKWQTYRNLMLTMLLGGLWHGAAWNFVLWGAYHGTILCVYRMVGRAKQSYPLRGTLFFPYLLKVLGMFILTCGGWVFFRSQNLAQIQTVLSRIITGPWHFAANLDILTETLFFSAVPLAIILYDYLRLFRLPVLNLDDLSQSLVSSRQFLYAKSVVYGMLMYLLCLYAAKAQSFIYFQF